jgi:hypothetical protein
LAVANLGALREVLRAKNLHNTSDIPVTDAHRQHDAHWYYSAFR